MHCMELRAATLMLVDRQRTTDWQSEPRRLVSTPTSAESKKATSRAMIDRNSSALHAAHPQFTTPTLHFLNGSPCCTWHYPGMLRHSITSRLA